MIVSTTTFVEKLLATHRGGRYVRSEHGNSQMISDAPELFVPPMSAAPLSMLAP